jgi:hypothetical protein
MAEISPLASIISLKSSLISSKSAEANRVES